jgi:hypothetical protein
VAGRVVEDDLAAAQDVVDEVPLADRHPAIFPFAGTEWKPNAPNFT